MLGGADVVVKVFMRIGGERVGPYQLSNLRSSTMLLGALAREDPVA